MKMDPSRLRKTVVGFAGMGVLLILRLGALQVMGHAEFSRIVETQTHRLVPIVAPRGSIYDRDGYPLAYSEPAFLVSVVPHLMPSLDLASRILATVLNLDPIALRESLTQAVRRHAGYVPVKHRASAAEVERLRTLQLRWVNIGDEEVRRYPGKTLAAHVIGSTDFETRGNAGIELALDSDLHGLTGFASSVVDAFGRTVQRTTVALARPGHDITLSLKSAIQDGVERALENGVTASNARSGSAVVLDPVNGEIFALASFPTFDPNVPPQPGDSVSARGNLAVSVPFEPGSAFKTVTFSAALETTSLTPDSAIDCGNGSIRLYWRIIHDTHSGLGLLPLRTVVAKSSNVGAVEVGMRVGSPGPLPILPPFRFRSKDGHPAAG